MNTMTSPPAASTSTHAPTRTLPRRVLHVLNGAAGGAALSTIDLMQALRASGVDSAVVCHDAGSGAERRRLQEAADGRALFTPLYWWNRKIRAAAWKRPLLELRQLYATGFIRGSSRQVARAVERWGCDLIHTNTLTTPEGGEAARRLRLPHVWHVRELIGLGMPYRFKFEGPALGRYLKSRASLVVANSYATAESLQEAELGDRLRVVPNGIDLSRFVAAHREAASADRPLIVGMVGNLTTRWKKQSLFFAAAAAATAANVEFRVYGHPPDGAARAVLEASLAALGLKERLRLVGFVDDPVRIMSEIDVLVHTADHESFGRILVEAMASGLPVIGVRGGGAAEIVLHEQTGLLAAPDDAAEIARQIDRLAEDPTLRASLGAAGRRRAETHYGLARCVAEMLEVYADACERPSDASDRGDR